MCSSDLRVAIEGPYGAFTRFSKTGNHVLLVGAGVGVTPLRALLEDLPHTTDVVCVLRAGSEEQLPHLEEIRRLVDRRDGQLHVLTGPRDRVRMDEVLPAVVPDLAGRDIYVCGPGGFTEDVEATARRWGADGEQIHSEAFAF